MQDKQLRYLCLLILFSTFWRTIFGQFYFAQDARQSIRELVGALQLHWAEPSSTSQRRSIYRLNCKFNNSVKCGTRALTVEPTPTLRARVLSNFSGWNYVFLFLLLSFILYAFRSFKLQFLVSFFSHLFRYHNLSMWIMNTKFLLHKSGLNSYARFENTNNFSLACVLCINVA